MADAKNNPTTKTATEKPATEKPAAAATAAPAKVEKAKTVFVTNKENGPRGFYGDDGIEKMLDPRETVELELSDKKQTQLKAHGFKVSATKPKTQAEAEAEEAEAE